MKTPHKLEIDSIATIIESNFGINVTDIEFIPEGEVAWIYRCRSAGKSWVIKLQKRKPSKTDDTIVKTLQDAGYAWMPAQVLTVRGDVWAYHRRMYYSVQQYVETGNNKREFLFDDEGLPQLGKALRTLHDTELPPRLLTEIAKQSHHTEWSKRLKVFLRKVTYSRSKKTKELRQVISKHKKDIYALLQDYDKLVQLLKHDQSPKVLVHGDIHPYNVLFPPEDHAYIIDWDKMSLSHRERDLMYFDDRQIDLLSQGYGEDLLQNKERIDYYRMYLWVRELAFFGDELALRGHDETTRQRGVRCFKEALANILDKRA